MRRSGVALRAAAALLALAAATLGWARPASACAACGNPTLPQTTRGVGTLADGAWVLGASVQTMPLYVTHDAGCADVTQCDETPVQPLHEHRVLLVPTELNLHAEYGFGDGWAVEGDLPFRAVVSRVSYALADGTDYTPVDAGTHHRDETVAGLADGGLSLRRTLRASGWWWSLRLGATLPLGATEPNPFELGDAGKRHQHIQLGTGVVAPSFGVAATRGGRSTQVTGYATLTQPLYANRRGFEPGGRALGGVSVGYKARPGWLVSGLAEGAWEGPERWDGEVREDGMTGLAEARVGASVQWRNDRVGVGATLRTPVWRYIVPGDEAPGEVLSPVSLALSVDWAPGR